MTLGEKMKNYRGENKVTQKQLASDVGYSPVTISYIESGWDNRCSLPKFAKMAIVMQLTPEEVYDIVMSSVQERKIINAKCNC